MNTNRKIGKLILIETKQKPIGLCKVSKTAEIGNPGTQVGKICNLIQEGVHYYWIKIEPIIICDDEIKAEDWFYSENERGMVKANRYIVQGKDTGNYKTLVFPNQSPTEFLQAIVDGKIKDGDKVEVEMEIKYEDFFDGITIYPNYYSKQIIKLRKDGTAIIHPHRESVEEAAERYAISGSGRSTMKAMRYDAFKAGVEWYKNQK